MSSTIPSRTPQTRSQTKKVSQPQFPSLSSSLSGTNSHRNSYFDDIPLIFVFLVLFASFAVFALASFGYFKYHNKMIQVPKLPLLLDRLVYTLQLQAFSLIPLALSLLQVMLTRLFTKAINPLSGNEYLVEKAVRILTNTVEQFIFSFVNQLILVTILPAQHLYVIPFIVALFTFGRILFFISYNINPMFRTLGFVLTFVPTLFVLGFNLLHVSGLYKFHLLTFASEQSVPLRKAEL